MQSTVLAESATSIVAGGSLLLAAPIAAAAGAISFASPCVLPLVPGYLSYVTGMSAVDAQAAAASAAKSRLARGRTAIGATLFVAGFTAVFVSAGAAFGFAGDSLRAHLRVLELVFGALMILMGVYFSGVLPAQWGGWLSRDLRLRYRPMVGLVGAPLLGVVFGLGWTPCLGPTLAVVETLAITQGSASRGALLSAAYCVGLGLPFILAALLMRKAMTAFGWIKRHHAAVARAGGLMLACVGVLMVSGLWDHLIILIQTHSTDYLPL